MTFSPAALGRSALIGAATGLRSSVGVAGVALAARGRATPGPAPLRLVSARPSGSVLAVCGELVADKLPSTPSRLKPQALVPRVVAGAVAAVALAQLRGVSAGPRLAAAAGTGALTSLLGSYAGARYRALAAAGGRPDLPFALGEDAAALALAAAALRL